MEKSLGLAIERNSWLVMTPTSRQNWNEIASQSSQGRRKQKSLRSRFFLRANAPHGWLVSNQQVGLIETQFKNLSVACCRRLAVERTADMIS